MRNEMTENNQYRIEDAIKGFIYAITLLEAPTFFAIYAITGRTYAGSESSYAYIIYMVMLLVIQALILIRRGTMKRKELGWLIVPLVFVGLAWIFSAINHETLNMNNVRNIILWQYTGILLAINLNSFDFDNCVVKSLVILMLVITIGSIVTVLLPFLRGRALYVSAGYSLTGSSFQAQSYYTALCVGISIFMLSVSTKTGTAKIAAYILVAVQLLCVILYAGRGGMVLALAYLLAFFMFNNQESVGVENKLLRILAYFLALVIIFLLLKSIIAASPMLQRRFGRVFSYLSNGGIDMSQTSNRDVVYSKAIDYIKKSPVFGYGILGYLQLDGLKRYPHNIVLEMMLEGGIIYLLLWIFVIVSGFRRIRHEISEDRFKILVVIAMFSAVKLTFSGSYSCEMLFWFAVVFSHICYREVSTE